MRRTALPIALVAFAIAPATALAHGMTVPGPTFPAVLLAWRFDPLTLVPLVAAGAAYLWAARRVNLAHPGNRHPATRTWLFLGGLAAIGLALTSPIEVYEGALFSVHMVQHMVLELLAAPLLLAGGPITLALRVASPGSRRRLLSILHSPPLRALSFPVLTWLVFAAVNWGWHFSVLYDQALENPALHYFQHATFLGAALLFWWPVIGVDPAPWRMPYPLKLFYLFLALPQNSFLGVSLLNTGTVLYSHYVTNARTWGPSPIDDQAIGGIVMWVAGDMAFLVAMAVVVWAWTQHEERRTAGIDARLAADRAARGEPAWTPRQPPGR